MTHPPPDPHTHTQTTTHVVFIMVILQSPWNAARLTKMEGFGHRVD